MRLRRRFFSTSSGSGLLFGTVAIAGMHLPFRYAPGIIFDGRSIVLALAGLFAGAANAAIAALMTALYRLQIGARGHSPV